MSEKASEKTEKRGKGGKITLAICMLLIVALLGVIAFLLWNNKDKESSGEDKVSEAANRGIVVNEKNVDELIENSNYVAPGYYRVTMNSTWNFPNGSSPSDNAYVSNATSNVSDVYFDVIRSDTKEIIYSSPVLPVGTYLEGIKLDTELPAGSYDCIVEYHTLNSDGNTEATLQIALTVVVEQ